MGKNLVTKAEYKAYAGINSINQDAQIDSIIPKVSELVKTYCRRSFVDYIDDVKTEILDGGFSELLLAESPVTQVVSVSTSDDYGQTYTKLTKFTDWVARGDVVHSTQAVGFPEKLNGYKVSYFAGYETVPEDLKLAVLDLVSYYMRNDAAVHNNRTPGGGGSVQLEYVMNTNLPAHIKRVLDLYVANYA